MKRAAQQHEEAAPQKRLRSSYSEVFKVVVGPGAFCEKPWTFTVHEDVLARQSGFFKAAGKNPSNKDQNQQKIVRLPLVNPSDFRRYLNLLYNPSSDECGVAEFASHTDHGTLGPTGLLCSLCSIWITAEYLEDTEITDRAMAAIIYHTTKTQCRISPRTMILVAEGASVESGLYRWMLEFISRTFEVGEMDRAIGEQPGLSAKLVFAVLEKLLSLRTRMPMPTDAAAYCSSDEAA